MGEGEEGEISPKKEQQELVEAPAKKLARQLDFTAGFGGASSGGGVLPEHPQSEQPLPPVALYQQHPTNPQVPEASALPQPPQTTAEAAASRVV